MVTKENGELFVTNKSSQEFNIYESIDEINGISIDSQTEEINAKIGEIFGNIEATPNNPENMEISEGVNIALNRSFPMC